MTKTTTTKTTTAPPLPPVPPWRSRQIWAAAIAGLLGLAMILIGALCRIENLITAGSVIVTGAATGYLLGRGIQMTGVGLLLLVALGTSACAVTQAQVAVQTSLTGLAEGVHAGDEAIALAVPRLTDAAIERARDRCATTCTDPLALYEDEVEPLERAVDGLEVATEALRVAQAAQNAWVASDQLPDAGPLCEALGDAVRPVAGLLDEAGVDVPPGIAGAGGVVEVICGVVARWATTGGAP